MKAHTNEANEDKSRPAASVQAQNKSGLSLTAGNPKAVAQQKLHEMANSSIQVKQLQVLQQMADNKHQAVRLQQTTVNKATQPVQLLVNPLPYISKEETKLADHNFTVNHLASSGEFTIAKAKERANRRGSKNTILNMDIAGLRAELEKMLKDPRAPFSEINASVGTSIEKPTVREFEWVTATRNADPALQVVEGGKNNLNLRLNVNAAATSSKPGEVNTPTVKVFHLEATGLTHSADFMRTKASEDAAEIARLAELARMEAAHIARLAAKKEKAKAKASAKAEPATTKKKNKGKKKAATAKAEDLPLIPGSETTDETFDEEEVTTPITTGAGVPTVMEEYKERRSEEADTTDDEEEEETEETVTTGEWLSQQAWKGLAGIKKRFWG